MGLIQIFVFAILTPSLLHGQESEFQPIDLKTLEWNIVSSWSPDFKDGFDPEKEPGSINGSPPFVLNEMFHVPVGTGTEQYTAQTVVHLTERELNEDLMFDFAWIGENWAIYINGKVLRKEIYLNEDGSIKHYRTYRGAVIPIRRKLLKAGENRIVIHFIGNKPATPLNPNDNLGLLYERPYEITTQALHSSSRAEILYIGLYTVYFFFGLYHILFFSRRSREVYNLFFGLFSILLAIYGFSQTQFIHEFFFDTSYLVRIRYAVQPVPVPLFVLFLQNYFFPDKKRGVFVDFATLVALILVLSFFFAPYRYMESLLLLFYVYALPTMIYGAGLILYAVYKKKSDSVVMLFSGAMMLGTVVFEILDSSIFNTGIRVIKYGFFAFVMSLVGILANRFLRVQNESERLNVELLSQKNAFLRFVPTQFLELLGKQSAVDIKLGDSSLQTMSVLMCDLRAFTNLSERMTPEETFEFLNSYLAHMEPAIQRYDGFVDKFVGDAILALFSDMEASQEMLANYSTADRALHAAMSMRVALASYNEERKSMGKEPIDFGIGINTGPLIIGTVGSERRIDTTVIGNTVNLASRVEALTTFYKASIIITDSVYKNLSSPDAFHIREIDTVVVKGKSEPSVIYEVFDNDPENIKQMKELSHSHIHSGMIHYKSRNFADAVLAFHEALKVYPDDRVAHIFAERCNRFLASPPPESWSGVFELQHK